MGAGKSAVGRELAQRLQWPRHDTDELVRAKLKMTITEIFERQGEAAFRLAEAEVLRRIPSAPPNIVVTGGGVLVREENAALLALLGTRVWLAADEELLWKRASRRGSRPLLRQPNPRENFSALFRNRQPVYRAAADHRVDIAGQTISEVATAVLKLV